MSRHTITLILGGINFGVDGAHVGAIDVSNPSPAWMVAMVEDENEAPSLHWSTKQIETTFNGTNLTVNMGVLTSKPPMTTDGESPQPSLCLVKTVAGEKYAILKRGLVYLSTSFGYMFFFVVCFLLHF